MTSLLPLQKMAEAFGRTFMDQCTGQYSGHMSMIPLNPTLYGMLGPLVMEKKRNQDGTVNSRTEEQAFAAVLRDIVEILDPAQPLNGDNMDDVAVNNFAEAMRKKMALKRSQGRTGWWKASEEELNRLLREHLDKGDPVDIGNFAMMIFNNSQRVAGQK